MSEREPRSYGERFDAIRFVQTELERSGYYFYPIEKEHTEALLTEPLADRIRRQIKKRGFEKVAGKVAITFSGYAHDDREIFAVPEIRAYWQKLDRQLPELPAVLTHLPELGFNGPGLHLMLTGTIDQMVHRPGFGGYDVRVADAPAIIDRAVTRIRQSGQRYKMNPNAVNGLVRQFVRSATHRFPGH